MKPEQTSTDHPKEQQTDAKSPRRRRKWRRVLIDAVGIYVVWCLALYFYQGRLLFPNDLAPEPGPEPTNEQTFVTELDIGGGQHVEAWFIPTKGLSSETPGPVVIFFHGNAEIIDYQDFIVQGYLRLGCSVMLPEYRGYGRSGGKPSQKALRADNVRFYDELVQHDDIDKSRIVFHGRSLGGAVAADLAKERMPAALILESTVTSVAVMAHKYWVPSFLVRNPFHTDHLVAEAEIPLLIFHGSGDPIIPVRHGRALSDLSLNGTYVEYDCGHNDFPGDQNEQAYWAEIESFLECAGIISRVQR